MPTLRLGRALDPATLTATGQPATLDTDALTRHAVCVGMTGSGKTGVCIGLLEQLAGAGVPILAIDPKGDLANLALVLDNRRPEQFAPWVDPAEATRKGLTVPQLAEATAARWRKGLADDGVTDADVAAWKAKVAVTVYTPGSEAGVPVDVLTALTSAPRGLRESPEDLREYVTGAVSALLGLVGREANPLTDPASILLARLLGDAFRQGLSMPLSKLIPAVIDPPFQELGYFALDEAIPPDARQQLARELNAVVSSPAFAGWLTGEALDVAAWMKPGADGRTPVRVLSLAHLDDAQRQFFVTLLMHAVVAWSRQLPGTGALRALVYFDEVAGYLPPHPKDPPTKAPVLTLMKQARSVGVGVMLCTQNPVDVDYKAMSNAGTWLIGRLQTKQDRARVVGGLQAAIGEEDAGGIDALIGKLPKRTFVWRTAESASASVLESRFVMSFLRGPLTRREIAGLGQKWGAAAGATSKPTLPPGLPERWLLPAGAAVVWQGVLRPDRQARSEAPAWEAALYARLKVRFVAQGTIEERIVHWFSRLIELEMPPRPVVLDDAWLGRAEPVLEPGKTRGYHAIPDTAGIESRLQRVRAQWLESVRENEVWRRTMEDGEERVVRAERRAVEVVGWALVWA
jgi:hypothetical protein